MMKVCFLLYVIDRHPSSGKIRALDTHSRKLKSVTEDYARKILAKSNKIKIAIELPISF
jgi:hypothetical protein